jgi:LacI family transcriptional regulator
MSTRRKAVTIRDVAKKAGVGVSTVSYVLNGNDNHVGPATREQILAAVRELNYRPNAIARSMVRRATATIGLIITELNNPLFVPVAEGVEAVLKAEGYHIILVQAKDVEDEISAIETLRAQQVDGLIFMSLSVHYESDHLKQLTAEGVPFVLINRDLDDMEINQIKLDDWGAAYTITQHLIDLGHKRIATITGPRDQRRSAEYRHKGWLEALNANGLAAESNWIVSSPYTYEGGFEAAQQLLEQLAGEKNGPTAVFIANEAIAIAALKVFHGAGINVPDDLAIVTIGDPPFAAYTIPALTTMALPVVQAGQIGATIVVDWLREGKPPQPQYINLGFTLHIRESCGANKRALP